MDETTEPADREPATGREQDDVGTRPVRVQPPVERWVFWPAAGIVLAFVAVALIAPRATEDAFTAVQGWIVRDFGWYYVIAAAAFVVFAIWIGFSRFGDIVLGRDDEQPEFSTLSWLSLLFAAGMGIGLVFYGVAEPLSHFASPRPGVTGDDDDQPDLQAAGVLRDPGVLETGPDLEHAEAE